MNRSLLVRVLFALVASFLWTSASAQGHKTWFLAEGATTPFFEEEILIGNPNATEAMVDITFLKSDATTVPHQLVIPPTSRATLRVNDIVPNDAVSAVVDSTQDIIVERSMYFRGSARDDGHNSPGVTSPALTWRLAEGATGFFDAFVLIANPSATTDAQVKVTFLRSDGGPAIEKNYTLQASGRFTIWVNVMVPELGAAAFSTVVESQNGVAVIVERAMYWNAFAGGHGTSAVTALSTTWRFAEGFTGSGFDTFLLIGNPDPIDSAQVRVTFFLEVGPPTVKIYTIAPSSRFDIWVNLVEGLENAPFSMLVESTNGVPTVAERAMYTANFVAGHVATGLTAATTRWGFAEGLEHGHHGTFFRTFYLLANSTPNPAQITATFYREDGTGIVRTFTVGAKARFTLPAGLYPELSNQTFAAFFESTNGTPVIAERAVYWDDSFFGAHASPGTAWTAGAFATPPAPPTPTTTGILPTSGPVGGGTAVTLTGTNYSAGATVSIGGSAASSVTVLNATTITAGTKPHAAGAVDVVVTSNGVANTLMAAFTYEAPAPPPPPLPPITITLTDTSLAFGDSITFGTTTFRVPVGLTAVLYIAGTTTPYTVHLENMLRAKYPSQTITVRNAGIPGEPAVAGQNRLPGTLSSADDLVIVLQGVNDTNGGVPTSQIVAALSSMVRTARSAGKQVILCTLTPAFIGQSGLFKADPALISAVNALIPGVAAAEGAVLVDLHAAFGNRTGLMSPDGLHPNDLGYQLMAQELFDAIVANFETTVTPTP